MAASLDLSTLLVHGDCLFFQHYGDIAPPIHVSSTFEQRDNQKNFHYGRTGTPTRTQLEITLSAAFQGQTITYSSGLAATQALLHYVQPKTIVARCGYHGTRDAINMYVESRNKMTPGTVTLIENAEKIEKIDMIWLEMPNNPYNTVEDMEKWRTLAKEKKAVLALDTTLSSPVGIRAFDLGADFVVESATKYLGGHSDVLAGVIAVNMKTHTKAIEELFKERNVLGATLGSLEAFLLLRSLRTLTIRVERQSATAFAIARFLESHPRVKRVFHCFLESHESYSIARKQLKLPPATFSFEMHTQEQAQHFVQRVSLARNATSLGGVESLIDWRYRWDTTLSPSLLRLSVGLEHVDDLIADFKRALDELE